MAIVVYEDSFSLNVCALRAQSCRFEMNTCDNEIITTQIKIFLKLMLIPFVSVIPAPALLHCNKCDFMNFFRYFLRQAFEHNRKILVVTNNLASVNRIFSRIISFFRLLANEMKENENKIVSITHIL